METNIIKNSYYVWKFLMVTYICSLIGSFTACSDGFLDKIMSRMLLFWLPRQCSTIDRGLNTIVIQYLVYHNCVTIPSLLGEILSITLSR